MIRRIFRRNFTAEVRTVEMDLSGVGYHWVSERPDRFTTAARLREHRSEPAFAELVRRFSSIPQSCEWFEI